MKWLAESVSDMFPVHVVLILIVCMLPGIVKYVVDVVQIVLSVGGLIVSSINRLNGIYSYKRPSDKRRPSCELTLFHFTAGTVRGLSLPKAGTSQKHEWK